MRLRLVYLFAAKSLSLSLWRRLAVAAALFALFLLGRHIWDQRLLPPLGTDSLIYHLALPAYWLQRGYLAPLDLPFQPGTVEQPMFAETIAYAILYLTKSDTWIWLIQPLFFLHLLWLFFHTSRRLGAPASVAAALTAHLALFTPFTRNIAVFNNDVILTWASALWGWGICHLWRRWRFGVLLAAASMGLMMATKAVGILYAASSLLSSAIFMIAKRAGQKDSSSLRYSTLAVAALLFFGGSAFFLRNLFIYGNPFYPQEVRIGGQIIFPGLYDLSAVVDHPISWDDVSALFLSGEGFASSALDAPVFAVALPVSAFAAIRGPLLLRLRSLLALAWPLLSAALYFSLFPNWPDPRFIFPLYYGLWLATAQAASICCLKHQRQILLALLAWLAIRLYFLPLNEVWGWAIAAGALAMIIPPHRLPRLISQAAGMAALALLCSAPWWFDEYCQRREAVRPQAWETLYGSYGRAWYRLWEMSRSKSLVIAYTGTPWIFPLFGPRLENRVVYLPISPADQPQPVVLQPGEWPVKPLLSKRRGVSDDNYWLEMLRRESVDILFICDNPAYGGAMPEQAMISRHRDRFRLFFRDGNVQLYTVQNRP
ncbi:MAG: hypothetical protein N3A66_00650 [Planctomycetota bacterium]|nr:hypothetical protein [Planctomycetota bacterium]